MRCIADLQKVFVQFIFRMAIQLLEACLLQGLLKFVNYDPLKIGYDFDMIKEKRGVSDGLYRRKQQR